MCQPGGFEAVADVLKIRAGFQELRHDLCGIESLSRLLVTLDALVLGKQGPSRSELARLQQALVGFMGEHAMRNRFAREGSFIPEQAKLCRPALRTGIVDPNRVRTGIQAFAF